MTLAAPLFWLVALSSLGLGLWVALRDRSSTVHRTFALGMGVLALENILLALTAQAAAPGEVQSWQRLRWLTAAFIPGVWLAFALSFGKRDPGGVLGRWGWVLGASFFLPLLLAGPLGAWFFLGPPRQTGGPLGWNLPLGQGGMAFLTAVIVEMVLVVMLLERALRATAGAKRWQLKFLVLGVGVILAARILGGSQALLYRNLDLRIELLPGAAGLVGNLLLVVSLLRTRDLQKDLLPSPVTADGSLTLILWGTYFLVFGALSQLFLLAPDRRPSHALIALLSVLALLGVLALLLSMRLRLALRRFVSRNLLRPRYDYRQAWTAFGALTSSHREAAGLCDSAARAISSLLEVPSVTVWVADPSGSTLSLGGSTELSEAQVKRIPGFEGKAGGFLRRFKERPEPVDALDPRASWALEFPSASTLPPPEGGARHYFPLVAGGEVQGVLGVGMRPGRERFTVEDMDLMQTISGQLAGSLRALGLDERLRRTEEMQTVQTLAAFFLHDLRNLASKLSVMLQNLPRHFDNPSFRGDAARLISQSVARINTMCGRLTLLSGRMDLARVPTDLPRLVRSSLRELDGVLRGRVAEELLDLPPLPLDQEQFQKLLTNLFLNASEALPDEGGEIRVTTSRQDPWAVLTVADNGRGISREFMERSLFRLFQSSKKNGLGIGLYQSKMIVEAHGGRIEVESEEGRGTTFRVLLPLAGGGERPMAGEMAKRAEEG